MSLLRNSVQRSAYSVQRTAVSGQKKLNSKGFTLIEVLVAVTILAIGLVLVVQAMGRTQQALRLSENISRAAYVAEEELVKMELKVREYGRASFGGESGKVDFPRGSMKWETSVRPFMHGSIKDGLRTNTLGARVDWVETNRPNSMEVQTMVLNRKK